MWAPMVPSPMKPIFMLISGLAPRILVERSSAHHVALHNLFIGVLGFDDALRYLSGAHGRRPPGVECEVRDELAQLTDRDAILQRPFHMDFDEVRTTHTKQTRDCDEAAVAF